MSRKSVPDELVCKAIKERLNSGWPPICTLELLQTWTGEPEKVCYAAMERADDHGLIEWGVSLRTAWLTDKGKALLSVTD